MALKQPDFNWRACYPDKKIYISREHNWAFAAWEIAKMNKAISENSLLIHVDAHIDDIPDGVNVPGLFDIETVEDVIKVTQGHDFSTGQSPSNFMMGIANFIWAGIGRKTIGETIFVSSDRLEPSSLESLRMIEARIGDGEVTSGESRIILDKLVESTYQQKFRFYDVYQFAAHFNQNEFIKYVGDRDVILDLDLDYFNKSGTGYESDLYSEESIREQMKFLKDFYNWDLITVALSPAFCGYNNEWEYLFKLFKEEFDLNNDGCIEW